MHNKPHSPETIEVLRAIAKERPRKWGSLPRAEIVERLLNTEATVRSIATEYGCSDATIKLIFREHTTKEQRLSVKAQKQAARIRGRKLVEHRKQRDPIRVGARMRLNNAVRDGHIERPERCQQPDCDYAGRVEAHHWKGYSDEHALDVVWLCPDHHRFADLEPEVWVITFRYLGDVVPEAEAS